jgi:hypothetical protein
LESREVPALDMGEKKRDQLGLLEHHIRPGPQRVGVGRGPRRRPR